MLCQETNDGREATASSSSIDSTIDIPLSQPPILAIGAAEEDGGTEEEGDEVEEDDQDPLTQPLPEEDEMGEHDPPQTPPVAASSCAQKLERVYGEKIHQNDGTHLDGGVVDDKVWQARWREVMALPPQRYDVPSGRVGRLFVQAVADELKGVVQRSWNSERFVVFQAVILQRSPDVKRARDIRRRIEIRLRHWREKQFTMLIKDTVQTSRALISTIRRGM